MARSVDKPNPEQRFADVIPDLVCQCQGGLIVWLNAAGAAMLGLSSPADAVGMPFANFVHDDYRPAVSDGLGVLAEEIGSVPLMFVRMDGGDIEAEVRTTVIEPSVDGHEQVVIHARDVTERVRAVGDVLESEARYRRLVNLALDFMCLAVDNTISMVNAAGVRLLDYPDADALTGQPVQAIVHHDYHGILDLGLDTLAGESGQVPLKFITADGVPVDVEIRVMRLDESGQSFMIEARDIRRRLRSAEALREREQRLQGILDTVAEGIVTANDQGIIQSFNKAAELIFGYDASEAVGQNLAILMPEQHARLHDAYMGDYHKSGIQTIMGRGRELEGRRKDGRIFPLELNISELRLGKARIFTGIIRDITDRKSAEAAERHHKQELELKVEERTRDLRRLTRETQGILDSAGDGIVGLDMDGVVTFANPAAAAMLKREGELLGRPAAEIFCYGTGRRRGRGVPVRAALRRGLFHDLTEVTLLCQDGTFFPAEYASSPIEDDGDRVGAVVVFRDISERKAAEERLTVAAAVFDTTAEGIVICGTAGQIFMTNPAFERITGWPSDVALTTPIGDILFEAGSTAQADMMATLEARGHWERELWARRRGGEAMAIRLVASFVAAEEDSSNRVVVMLNDITQRKRDEERIRYQASYDMLTGLPNRALFHDRLEQAVASALRGREKVGLMFIDLDGFKAINDTLGHDAGDVLLKGAAKRLKDCVRESDTVARLGGDEFTVIMTHIEGPAGAAEVASRIIAALTEPFELGDKGGPARTGNVSASIGIALLPDNGQTPEDILRHADAAMYHAKEQGKANYQFFHPELLSKVS